MTYSFPDLQNGVVLAELGGRGDGPYCAEHGAGGALVMLGTYIVDASDNVDYPKHFVFKPGRSSYVEYLKQHVREARKSGAKVGVSVCCVEPQDNVDFLQAAKEAGADYASYCAHSVMEMFVSRNLSSKLCLREHWNALRKWATTMVTSLDIPLIFKIGVEGSAEETSGAVEVMAEAGVPIVHINVEDCSSASPGLETLSALKGKCQFLIAGGGIKTAEDARRVLAAGADAVAIGTAAMHEPELIGRIQRELRN